MGLPKGNQIAAARALLGWDQKDVAERVGISVAAISKIEKGENKGKATTLENIQNIFERNGVVFTPKGVEFEEYPIIVVEGNSHETCYIQLLHDAYEHIMGHKNKELLIMFADDKVSPPSVNDMYRKMRANGIIMRQLILENNTYIIGPLDEYRYIPSQFFINRVTLVYGDKVATETGDFNKALIKIDPIQAEIQRNTFNLLWSVLKQPKKTTCDERF